jgi:signal transduction histidine kinase/DNA-binding response OmpR family regulator
MKKNITPFVIALLVHVTLFAQKTLVISDTVSSIEVCEYSSVFRDVSQRITFNEVKKQRFKEVNQPIFQYAFSDDVFWFRFQVRNESRVNTNNWYLTWSDGLKDHVDVYVPQSDGSYQVQKGGLLTPTAEKAYQGPFPLYKIGFLPTQKTETFYVRIKANDAVLGTLTLMTHQAYIDQMPGTLATVWLVIGIQLLRVLYNIVLARYIKNTSFRWYSFHTVVVTLSVLGSFGIIGNALSNYPQLAGIINSAFFQLMPATYTLFIYSLLNVGKNYPRIRWLFAAVVTVSVLQVIANFIAPRVYLLQINNYLFLVTECLLIGTTLDAFRRRLAFNAYLLIPCFITLIPFIFLSLQSLGFINYGWIYPMIYLTNFLEIFALSFVIGKVIEMTEQERLQSEKALLTEKLEADKLVELDHLKTQFFTNISHEFRTPLTLLVAPLEDLRKKLPNEGLISVMQRNVNRLQVLINQLLDLSKLEAGELKVEAQLGDVAKFLSYIFSSFESFAQSQNIHFNVTQHPLSFEAYFDADKIEKILTNLLSNAFKFTPPNGRVEIKAFFQTLDSVPRLVFEIQDNGIGIDPQRLPRIFDRFYQVDDTAQRNYEGTGIGLALVKELVDILRGKIKVSSEVNKGTAFRVELPLPRSAQETTPYIQPKDIPLHRPELWVPPKSNSSPTEIVLTETQPIVLIVEDNPDLRFYLNTMFKPHYQIIEAPDGQNGLDLAFQFVPDIVVTDLMMPRLDGFELCQRLKSDPRTSHIPVVLLTAKATLADRLEGLELGADDYLQKPFSKEEVLIRVRNLIQQRALLRQKFSLMAPVVLESQPKNLSQELDNRFILKAKAIVESRMSDSHFSADEFSELMDMSRSNLHRKLKALTDQSTTEFVRKIRLHKAADLLQQTNMTVSEVAYQVGFESLPYFSKTFQDQFGVAPSTMAEKN